MRVKFSDKVHDLGNIIALYLDEWGQLKQNAPENIKKLYKEYIDLANKEYEDASL